MEYLFSLLLPHSLLFLTACLPSPLSLSAARSLRSSLLFNLPNLLIISPPLWYSPHFPPLIFPFYLYWPHFLLIFCLTSPLLVIPHPFVWSEPVLFPPSVAYLFFLRFLSSLHPLVALIFSSSYCVPLFSAPLSNICLSVYLSITLPLCPQNSITFSLPLSFLLPALPYSLFLSNSTYLPSLLPFDTLSPCPLIQSSLLYPPFPTFLPPSFNRCTDLYPSFITSLSFPLNLCPSFCLLWEKIISHLI